MTAPPLEILRSVFGFEAFRGEQAASSAAATPWC
jgi:hypothetical protein